MHRRAAWSTTIRLPTVTIRRIAYPHDRVSSIKRYGGYTPLRSPSRGGLEVTHHVTGRASWTATLASAMPRRALPCTPCYAQPCYAPACQPCHARPHGHVLQLSSDRPSDDTCRAPRRPSSPAVPSSLERPATRGQPARCATAGRGPRDWRQRCATASLEKPAVLASCPIQSGEAREDTCPTQSPVTGFSVGPHGCA